MKKLTYTLSADVVTANLVDKVDDTVTLIESVEFKVADFPEVFKDGDNPEKSLASYGLSKLLQDRTSSIDAEGKLEAMNAAAEMLMKGEWRQRKEGGGAKKAAIDPLFAMAIAEIKNVSVATATIALQEMEAEQRKAVRQLEPVKDRIAAIREKAEGEAGDLLKDMLS